MTLAVTGLYTAATDGSADANRPYYQRSQAEALVETYNNHVRRGVPGTPGTPRSNGDIHAQHRRLLLEESQTHVDIAFTPRSVELRVSF